MGGGFAGSRGGFQDATSRRPQRNFFRSFPSYGEGGGMMRDMRYRGDEYARSSGGPANWGATGYMPSPDRRSAVPVPEGIAFLGGSPWFDESGGGYIQPNQGQAYRPGLPLPTPYTPAPIPSPFQPPLTAPVAPQPTPVPQPGQPVIPPIPPYPPQPENPWERLPEVGFER